MLGPYSLPSGTCLSDREDRWERPRSIVTCMEYMAGNLLTELGYCILFAMLTYETQNNHFHLHG